MDQRTFDRKVTELAEKLKGSGVATSDTMAKQLAADIIRTEQSTKSDDLPEQQQAQNQNGPKNLVVEEAIKNAQGAAHNARVDDDVDQEKSIAELLEEDPSSQQQPKVTLDTPVVEGGQAREEKESTAFIQQKPQPEPVRQSSEPEVQQHQGTVQQEEEQENESEKQPEPEPEQQQAEPQKQEQQSEKQETKAETKVDLSEMFNFSKKN